MSESMEIIDDDSLSYSPLDSPRTASAPTSPHKRQVEIASSTLLDGEYWTIVGESRSRHNRAVQTIFTYESGHIPEKNLNYKPKPMTPEQKEKQKERQEVQRKIEKAKRKKEHHRNLKKEKKN